MNFTSVRACRIRKCSYLLSAVVVVLSAGCNKPQQAHVPSQPQLPSVQVRTRAVESKTFTTTEEVVSTVRAKLRATIEAKTTGRITEMPLVLGQRVKPGDLLGRLDAPEIKARLEQAEASLQKSELEWKRVSSLMRQQAVTRADYEAAEARYLVAKGAVAEAKALMAYVDILAPFEGMITKKWVDVGDLAAPGKPLVDIEDPSKLQLEADVPEAIAAKIRAGARMVARIGNGAEELTCTVAEISPNADPLSRTLRVKLDLATQGAAGLTRSGEFARLLVPVGEAASMRVPASAVIQRGQMEIVFAIENQHARLHLVKTGRQIKDETEILSGLDPGDVVVFDNANQLVDGQPLKTAN